MYFFKETEMRNVRSTLFQLLTTIKFKLILQIFCQKSYQRNLNKCKFSNGNRAPESLKKAWQRKSKGWGLKSISQVEALVTSLRVVGGGAASSSSKRSLPMHVPAAAGEAGGRQIQTTQRPFLRFIPARTARVTQKRRGASIRRLQ